MNPFRMFLVSLTRIPPAAMLAVIVGLAVTITTIVTSQLDAGKRHLQETEDAVKAKLDAKGKVVVAIKDIAEGETIPSEALEEREIEQGKIPTDGITSASLVAGRIAKYGISTNMIVSQHDLAPQGITVGFESRLKAGMRAITFAVDNNTGVAGFIAPESRIDILAMVGSGADTKAAPILSDVEVIAVGQMYQKNPGSSSTPASSVTVAVAPDDAQKLVKAVVASKIYLSLRNDRDHTPVATVDVTNLFKKAETNKQISMMPAADLLPPPVPMPMPNDQVGGQAINSSLAVPKPLHEIEQWSGGKKDILSVPNS
jgi:pilus assembly protein CpaB